MPAIINIWYPTNLASIGTPSTLTVVGTVSNVTSFPTIYLYWSAVPLGAFTAINHSVPDPTSGEWVIMFAVANYFTAGNEYVLRATTESTASRVPNATIYQDVRISVVRASAGRKGRIGKGKRKKSRNKVKL